MKRKILLATTMLACVVSGALGFAACDLFGGGGDEGDNDHYAVYHFNGGYYGSDPDDTEDYRYYLPEGSVGVFTPLKAKKDTWVLENWYFDEALTEVYSSQRFEELRTQKNEIDLYAKWIDRVTVTKDNFTEFFKVSSSWNGGLNAGGNAAINYSFEPVMAYDPALSTQSIEISVTPHIGEWSNGSNTVYLESDGDYFYYGRKPIDSSAAGTQFQIGSSTLSWTLITESFELQLLHRDPLTVHLDLGGGECEKDTLQVEGGHKLLKSELPTPQKSGYRFMGWYTDAEYNTAYEERAVTRERTLYAKYAKEVAVTFHANGGTEKDALALLGGDLINTYTPEREDYKFLGWYADAEFENKFVAGTRADEADVDLYAKWAKIHTITFVTNGGSAVEALRVVDGETPQMYRVSTSKSGVTFRGWYTDSACENKYEASPLDDDLTLYALWAREMSLYNPAIEDLKEYINFEITEEYTTVTENRLIHKIRKFTVTASIKEEYLRLGLIISGSIEIEFTLENGQDGGNGYFNNFTLSTLNGKLAYTGEYTVKADYAGYKETTTWKLDPHVSCTIYLPEEAE